MKEEFKRFDVQKANELLKVYKKKRYLGKISFLKELISLQSFFGEQSLLDCDLSLKKVYKKKTIESVLSDLDYTLAYSPVYITNWSFYGKRKSYMRIKFK